MIAEAGDEPNIQSEARIFAASAIETPESKDAEYFKFLKAADDLIERSRLGVYGEFAAPFTHQFKVSIRETYPSEKAAFEEIDRVQTKAINNALWMRIITFCLFLAFSALVSVPLLGAFSLGGTDERLIGFGVFGLGAIVFWAIRYWVRHEYLSTIGSDATRFANYFFKEASRIHDRAINAVHSSTEDLMMTPGWPDRSAGWIKIALWHSKRYENLDRYVTATAWKVESRYRQIEQVFVGLKCATAGLAIGLSAGFLLFSTHSDFTDVLLGVAGVITYLFVALFLWGLRSQVSNAFWGQKFRESIIGFDEQKEHIHNQIAKVIAADKKYYMGGQKNVGKEKN